MTHIAKTLDLAVEDEIEPAARDIPSSRGGRSRRAFPRPRVAGSAGGRCCSRAWA